MHRTSLFKEGNVINNDCSNTVKIRKCSYDELTTSSKCNMHRNKTRRTCTDRPGRRKGSEGGLGWKVQPRAIQVKKGNILS